MNEHGIYYNKDLELFYILTVDYKGKKHGVTIAAGDHNPNSTWVWYANDRYNDIEKYEYICTAPDLFKELKNKMLDKKGKL